MCDLQLEKDGTHQAWQKWLIFVFHVCSLWCSVFSVQLWRKEHVQMLAVCLKGEVWLGIFNIFFGFLVVDTVPPSGSHWIFIQLTYRCIIYIGKDCTHCQLLYFGFEGGLVEKGCDKRAKFSSSVRLFMFNKLYSFPNSHHLTLFFKNRFI